jgi:hypothetical protein
MCEGWRARRPVAELRGPLDRFAEVAQSRGVVEF